jgi:hypothetical protein
MKLMGRFSMRKSSHLIGVQRGGPERPYRVRKNPNEALILLKQVLACAGVLIALGGCSLDASIDSLSQAENIGNLNRKEPDLIHGEIVTSGNYQITGVFGEISEKTQSLNSNDWYFEGVFYE